MIPFQKAANLSSQLPRWLWIGVIAAMTILSIVAVQWIRDSTWRHKLDWPALLMGIGIPFISGVVGLYKGHQDKVQKRNELIQLENARRIEGIENQIDRLLIEFQRIEELQATDVTVLDRLRQLQRDLDSHLKEYGHTALAQDFRALQRLVEEIRAIVNVGEEQRRFYQRIELLADRLSTLAAIVENLKGEQELWK